jgi:hypothetical protein
MATERPAFSVVKQYDSFEVREYAQLVPNDAAVTLRALPRRRVAVVTYSGVWSEALYGKQLATLEAGVRAAGLKTLGAPMFARYDPPWKPWFMRTNEIQLEVDLADPVTAE